MFTELAQDYPELPEPYNNLAVLYASQGAYDKARNALEMAIRTHPSYATAHENLGDIYAKMASQAYDKALQLDRSNQAAQSKLNLIKELFSQEARPPAKVSATKPEAAPAPQVTPSAPAAPATTPPSTSAPAAAPSAAGAKASGAAPAQSASATGQSQAAAAPAKPTVAAAPAEAPAAASKAVPADQKAEVPSSSSPGNDEVMRFVNAWARAWSANDVRGYLASYAPDFQTPNKMSRSAWEAERKSRVAKPRKIEVEVASPKVSFEGKNRAIVSFKQHYRSGSLNVSGNKTLVMVKNGDKWLIQQERAGS